MKDIISPMLEQAGIKINGPHSWDIQVQDDRFYKRLFKDRALGLGESYMDAWWDSGSIDEMTQRLLTANLDQQVHPSLKLVFHSLKNRLLNLQSKWRSKEVAEKHYDLGNNLYIAMLDKTMNYSCGYWKDANTLEEAQKKKWILSVVN